MTIFTKALSLVRSAFKAAAIRFGGSGGSWGSGLLPRTSYNYAAEVDGRGSSIVVACVNWLLRTFPEAPLRIQRKMGKGKLEQIDNHRMLQVLDRPNPFYDGILLWWGVIGDWMVTGNAYLYKVRSAAGLVVELYWIPSWMIEPKWPQNGTEFISHYEYRPDGHLVRVAPSDIVHLRYGLDPLNPRKGLSPLASLVRELFIDDEAANFTAALLKNMGVPGVVIAPEGNGEVSDPEMVKLSFMQKFGGDRRGEPMVMSGPTKISVLSFNPEQMNTKGSRRFTEERVTAVFGTAAVVVGLGAGLDRSTFANFAEAREASYEGLVVPTQRLIAAGLATQLLPDFDDPDKVVLDYDLSKVRILQVDENDLHTRIREDVKAGLFTVNEGRQKLGMDSLGKDGDVLYIPTNLAPTDPAELLSAPEPMPMLPAAVPDDDEALMLPPIPDDAKGRTNGHALMGVVG